MGKIEPCCVVMENTKYRSFMEQTWHHNFHMNWPTYLCNQCLVSSNPVHGKVYYWIQHYVINFVSDLTGRGFTSSPGPPVSSINKTEILLKVALNTINKHTCCLKGKFEQCYVVHVMANIKYRSFMEQTWHHSFEMNSPHRH